MKRKVSLSVGLLALVVAAILLMAAPGRQVLPVRAADVPVVVQTINTAAIAASKNWDGREWQGGYERATYADVYWTIDQGTTPNTLTLKLQTSPDAVIWADLVTLATNNTTDVSGAYTTTALVGRYYRITATAGNTQTVTPTIKTVLR